MWETRTLLPSLLVLLFLSCITDAHEDEETYIEEVKVPQFVRRGEEVELECRWKVPGKLYSLKWYFNDREFFRFTPEQPRATVLPIPFVQVNENKSTGAKIVLNDVQFGSSGKYKCEITAEWPQFYTADKSNTMTVVDVPQEKPKIRGIKNKYHIGDEVHLTCTSAKSFPAANLTWYINNEKAPRQYVVVMNNTEHEQRLQEAHQGLSFVVTGEHFRDGAMTLKCTAEVDFLYIKSHQHSIDEQLTYNVPVMESRDISAFSGGALSGSHFLLVTLSVAVQVVVGVVANIPR
ncbi:cell adhesion molecule 3-like [Homarus americanus]|uniref:cell adhesion molecule 3-like n=1 Tax=Homarus americanus TaxID=6706 RepID=UPI001C445D51|nr:cell adhesion molecule 3-like [Homarus americanus]XP_042213974.1 cell adhesion molecule 3-like [Homarus americanus]XP_042213975.1 cell adhesion molecule 3-like [Homarus americanus]XP_042213976.1 cell adhesion molecule 3-like [Homarus americanus]XP_042213977.1 cell adhesion molecule 3-like [Homarus americanus]XP_042213978.1 cell adhesion molecule 3-like [Homarus americanus]XP_042213979.1 cell adhesion molecule 3-like [Homarus americanus]